MSKIDRTLHGPSWTEVILGAVLSLLLGIVLAMAVLIIRPVVVVKELPKPEERKRDTVYYVEGSMSTSKAAQAVAKRKSFLEGQSVTVTEDEVNAILLADSAMTKAGSAALADKSGKATAAETAGGDTLALGTPNVRIREGVLQVGAPVTLNALGLSEKVIVQARGGFAKQGDAFTYHPSEIYVGSLPVQRLPIISGYVRNRILTARQIPDDIAAAWRKLSDVSVEGNAIRLSP